MLAQGGVRLRGAAVRSTTNEDGRPSESQSPADPLQRFESSAPTQDAPDACEDVSTAQDDLDGDRPGEFEVKPTPAVVEKVLAAFDEHAHPRDGSLSKFYLTNALVFGGVDIFDFDDEIEKLIHAGLVERVSSGAFVLGPSAQRESEEAIDLYASSVSNDPPLPSGERLRDTQSDSSESTPDESIIGVIVKDLRAGGEKANLRAISTIVMEFVQKESSSVRLAPWALSFRDGAPSKAALRKAIFPMKKRGWLRPEGRRWYFIFCVPPRLSASELDSTSVIHGSWEEPKGAGRRTEAPTSPLGAALSCADSTTSLSCASQDDHTSLSCADLVFSSARGLSISATALEILLRLDRPSTTREVVGRHDLKTRTVQASLKGLLERGWISAERRGRSVFYTRLVEDVAEALDPNGEIARTVKKRRSRRRADFYRLAKAKRRRKG